MDTNADLRPTKRARLEHTTDGAADDVEPSIAKSGQNGLAAPLLADPMLNEQVSKEHEVGITVFVSDSRSVLLGTLKKRYTDFLVNEILPDGQVLHLQDTTAKPSTSLQSQHVDPKSVREDTKAQVPEPIPNVNEDGAQPSVGAEKELTQSESSENPAKAQNADVSCARSVRSYILTTVQISDDDRIKLVGYFSEEAVNELVALYESVTRQPEKKSREHPTVRTAFTSDRSLRSQIHQDIRRIFQGKIDSSTDKDGVLVLTAATASANHRIRQGAKSSNSKARSGRMSWMDRGGEYVHFTLYKENKDTLEVISFLTKQMRTTNRTFQFAGTKDRRAVTVQRASAYRVEAERLAGLNRALRFAAVGDFKYEKRGLELGDLSGNEFVVTLRDCRLVDSSQDSDDSQKIHSFLSESLHILRDKGFLNYYGPQRFGTFATRTDVVGVKILQGDFKGACDAILEFSSEAAHQKEPAEGEKSALIGQDDRARAEGIEVWRTTGRINEALDKIPRRFSAEAALIRHLGKHPTDFQGALLSIQRNLRLMYVHAYQSLVWNLAAGERWKLFGDKVVEGDLVLVHEHKDKEGASDSRETTGQQGQTQSEPEGGSGPATDAAAAVDADGEIIVPPAGEDRASDRAEAFERARALTAEEAASGAYSILDVVLPLPGFDVVYPANASGDWYAAFMASEAGGGLDPRDMRRRQKDFSLSGGYRKILARIGADFDVQVHKYDVDADGGREPQFVETDMEKLLKNRGTRPNKGRPPQSSQTLNHQHRSGESDPASGAAAEVQGGDSGSTTTAAGAAAAVQSNNHDANNDDAPSTTKVAAVLKFQLGSSQYATMALRELSRGGVQAYKTEFTGGR